VLTVYEASKLGGRTQLASDHLPGMPALIVIACIGLAAAWLGYAQNPPAGARTIPAIVVNAACESCPFDAVLARTLRSSYLQRAMSSDFAIDSSSPVHVDVEHYDPHSPHVAVRVRLEGDTLHLASDRSYPNGGAALRAMGQQLADAIAERTH
jgi:hypothetical protein